MEKAECILNGINPDDLPRRTLTLYNIASSGICRWKGNLSTAERRATYGFGVAKAYGMPKLRIIHCILNAVIPLSLPLIACFQ